MALDLDNARETFESSTDLTVGIEEEFAILDPSTLDLVDRYEELRDAAASDAVLSDALAGELIASEIEIRSNRGENLLMAIAAQRDRRRRLFALAADLRAGLGATGTHPWADYREQRIIDTEHYQRLKRDLGYVARRNNTFSLHVHVGVRGADRAVRVCNRLRPVLPLLLVASANSPYLDARDAGLHSARTQSFTRNFPRCGIPDALPGWDDYAAYLDLLFRTESIVEFTQVWWSVRPHVTFGTVEVRMCDAQSTASESEGIAGLVVATVAQAARDVDEGVPFEDPPGRLVEENLWRAIRYGQDGHLLDLESGDVYPSAAAVERLLEWTEPLRSELGIEVALPELNGAQRQRRMIDAGASMEEVYAACVRETRDTYPHEEVLA